MTQAIILKFAKDFNARRAVRTHGIPQRFEIVSLLLRETKQ